MASIDDDDELRATRILNGVDKEIEVGEYVRTDKGKIVKIDKEKKNLQILKFLDVEYGNILKHSFNIIDLIEVGDYVNGNEVLDKYLLNGDIPVLQTTGNDTNDECLCNGDIKTIVAKE